MQSEVREAAGLLDGLAATLEPYRDQLEGMLGEGDETLLDALPTVLDQWTQLRSAGGEVLQRMRSSRLHRLRRSLRPNNGIEGALQRLAEASPDQ